MDSCCSLLSSLCSLVCLKEFMIIFLSRKKSLFSFFSSFSLRCLQTMKELSIKIHLVLSREQFFLLCVLENTVGLVAGTKPYQTRLFSIQYAARDVSSSGCSPGKGVGLGREHGAPRITRGGAPHSIAVWRLEEGITPSPCPRMPLLPAPPGPSWTRVFVWAALAARG